jgi:hypothetical protein
MHGVDNHDDENDDGRWDQWLDGLEHEDKPLECFSDELALHSPGVVSAFDLSAHAWCIVAVTEIRDVEWEDQAMAHLVLDESEKRMLCSLVDDHSEKISKRIGDVISGKGLVGETNIVIPGCVRIRELTHCRVGSHDRLTWSTRCRQDSHSW